ncbi:uncharacterized protein BJ171DRAFT_128713 [Polychytrium aggregatum]|uniref:uncharacterized protein n=1 Tax=Polychytrium aggregatum TaxID=110093 RepID=UPI0022FDFD17|nr:uncharacterized protein BJ171DRAFT_128713 [Polychytrium aggregatum]KAI9204100.1 hypothetical protein BJ171DRAFT_128713 [Polychytrium aggregatum]
MSLSFLYALSMDLCVSLCPSFAIRAETVSRCLTTCICGCPGRVQFSDIFSCVLVNHTSSPSVPRRESYEPDDGHVWEGKCKAVSRQRIRSCLCRQDCAHCFLCHTKKKSAHKLKIHVHFSWLINTETPDQPGRSVQTMGGLGSCSYTGLETLPAIAHTHSEGR